MTNFDFQEYLYEQIPSIRKMGFQVVSYEDGPVTLSASLEDNFNHEMQAFGGSISSLLIMACWSQVYKIMQEAGEKCKILIQQSHIDFFNTIQSDFEAICQPPTDELIEDFLNSFRRFGKARINLGSSIYAEDKLASGFKGMFVALRK